MIGTMLSIANTRYTNYNGILAFNDIFYELNKKFNETKNDTEKQLIIELSELFLKNLSNHEISKEELDQDNLKFL